MFREQSLSDETVIVRQIIDPPPEPIRPAGIRCPGCGNIPRSGLARLILPSWSRFHCFVCGNCLIGTRKMIVTDSISYVVAAGFFACLFPFSGLLVAVFDRLGSIIVTAVIAFLLARIPAIMMQRLLSRRYIRVLE